FLGVTVLSVALMKLPFTQTVALVGSATLAHLAGSSVLGFFNVISSSTVTRSPFFKRTMTSLLIAAWPRTLTFGWVAMAGPGVTGAALSGSVIAATVFFGVAAGFF